jgi:hypothetical protein
MQENVAYEDVQFKDYKKSDRMLRSEAARSRRKETKQIREARVMAQWAKARRERKNGKSKS